MTGQTPIDLPTQPSQAPKRIAPSIGVGFAFATVQTTTRPYLLPLARLHPAIRLTNSVSTNKVLTNSVTPETRCVKPQITMKEQRYRIHPKTSQALTGSDIPDSFLSTILMAALSFGTFANSMPTGPADAMLNPSFNAAGLGRDSQPSNPHPDDDQLQVRT